MGDVLYLLLIGAFFVVAFLILKAVDRLCAPGT
jgi:hypothetical protein